MCIMKSSSCNTRKVLHLFWPDVMLPCFPALPPLYRNTWPAFGFWGGAVMQVSGGFCKIPTTSVIVREGCTKRTPSDPSSITATCLSPTPPSKLH